MSEAIRFEYSSDLSKFGADGWNYIQEGGPDGPKVVRVIVANQEALDRAVNRLWSPTVDPS